MVKKYRNNEHWLQYTWRPVASYTYIGICIADFILFPILWSLVQFFQGESITQWIPITMSNSGFIHLSFGTILGISAWTRGAEKIERNKNDASE